MCIEEDFGAEDQIGMRNAFAGFWRDWDFEGREHFMKIASERASVSVCQCMSRYLRGEK